jgi:hypothetical protein
MAQSGHADAHVRFWGRSSKDAYVIAGRLTRQFRFARRGEKSKSGFSGPIYPNVGWR